MQLKAEDMIKQKLLDAQENVRDYQEYSNKVEDEEVDRTFKKFAEDSGMQAKKLQELLSKYESNNLHEAWKEVTKSISYVIKEINLDPIINSFTASIPPPQVVGTQVTLNAAASGGIGTLQTKFVVNDGVTSKILKDYSTDTNATWTESKSGNYTITAFVKDANGKEVSKSMTYVISDTIAKNETTIYIKDIHHHIFIIE